MTRLSYRHFAITLTVCAAIAVSSYWGGVSDFGVARAANQDNFTANSSLASTRVTTTPLNAITAFDAAMIAGHVTGLPPLSTNGQKCAADVSNNGNLTVLDAGAVAQYVIGLQAFGISGTTVAAPCHTNWPTSVPVLKGDVTGQAPGISIGHGTVDVALPAITPPPGTLLIPVTVSDTTGLDIYSYEFQVTFDPAVIQPHPAWNGNDYSQVGTVSNVISVSKNDSDPGHLMVSGFAHVNPIVGSGALVNLRFDVIGTSGQSTTLTFEDYTGSDSKAHQGFLFNEGQAVAVTTNGSVTVAPSGISGRVTYGNAIGTPATRAVPNVAFSTAVGSPGVTGMSDNDGDHWLSGFGPGSYTVTPSKSGGVNNAITSFDAAKIAQHASGAALLTGNQLLAADVSGNGTVTSFDAGRVASFVAGSMPWGSTATWKMLPGERSYSSVEGYIVGQDYSALLMGDVSGNWTTDGNPVGRGVNRASGPERSIGVTAPRLVASPDSDVLIPVSIQGAAKKGIISYEFDLRYDPSVIQPQTTPVELAGTASSKLSFVANANEPGILRVVVYGPMPLDSNGVLLNLRFTAVGAPGAVSPLSWERIMFNEGDSQTATTDGRIELSAVVRN